MTGLSTTLAGIPSPSCLLNATGAWSGMRGELRELAASATGAVGRASELLRRHRVDAFVCHTPQLAVFVPALGGALDLIAVGGVSNGKDAQGALSRGAKAVQVGSALMKEGPGVFARIQQKLITERTTHESGA
jgi:Dihydroorotate dehydrogenase